MSLLHTLYLLHLHHGPAIRRAVEWLLAAVLLGLAGYGAYWSMTHYVTAAAQVSAAQENERLALALLNGAAQEKFVGRDYLIVTTFERKEQIFQRTP